LWSYVSEQPIAKRRLHLRLIIHAAFLNYFPHTLCGKVAKAHIATASWTALSLKHNQIGKMSKGNPRLMMQYMNRLLAITEYNIEYHKKNRRLFIA
jgi:hypothetical protein